MVSVMQLDIEVKQELKKFMQELEIKKQKKLDEKADKTINNLVEQFKPTTTLELQQEHLKFTKRLKLEKKLAKVIGGAND